MKRYRISNFSFDSLANILNLEINDSWDEKTKEMYLKNKEEAIDFCLIEFGEANQAEKIQNIKDLGPLFPSILTFHNKFLNQIRSSFIVEGYYPALVGACALGEWILNNLILKLRNYFKATPEYKEVYNKESFDNWESAIRILSSWNILLPTVVVNFEELKKIRNRAIHFNQETSSQDRKLALKAIQLISKIVNEQFGAFGNQPWLITGTKGAFFIKKDYEEDPFIKEIYLPNCISVSPFHKVHFDSAKDQFQITDNCEDNRQISDEEFVNLLETVHQ